MVHGPGAVVRLGELMRELGVKRPLVVTDKGVVVIQPRSTEYEGLTTGIPRRTGPRPAQKEEPAPEPKAKAKMTVKAKK